MNPIFGEPWDAPICEDAPRAETPVGVKCLWCQVPIEDGDRGILMAYMGAPDKEPTRAPYHRECLMHSTVGSPDHLDGKCTCRGGEPGAPQTPQEMRAEALEVWRRIEAGVF